ncbi:hypothetical protein [Caulobacter mirabilis]|uniref:Uncharacterized protein n=1 Tax=Caulobacter mirabilis TaxID=69666 RepID=A0A2D2AZK0_9CAUL|nr:hypothetical protein [Caulobacter mirabilis]ATQ43424.1 hypothetical protein CSW64_13880 [Caulobacter mirabilis]
MACSADDDPEGGYATAAAAMIALALSLVVVAVLAAALQELRFSRQAFDRSRAEFALDGAQTLAAQTITRSVARDRYRWTVPSAQGEIEVLAEAEAAKLPVAEATRQRGVLEAFGATQPEILRGRLAAWAAAHGDAADLRGLDPAPAWRNCAASMISSYGAGAELRLVAAQAPEGGRLDLRAAQVWRLRASERRGWVEERIVRFTGDPQNPAAVVERSLYRGGWMGEPCSDLFMDGDRR